MADFRVQGVGNDSSHYLEKVPQRAEIQKTYRSAMGCAAQGAGQGQGQDMHMDSIGMNAI